MSTRAPPSVSLMAVLYLTLAFPVVVLLVFATPPFQVPDEANHFLRALQIAGGHLIAEKLGEKTAGGHLDSNAFLAAHAFDEMKGRPDLKFRPLIFSKIAALQWGAAPDEPADFPNTAIYPPFLYAPAVFGLKIAEALGLSILDSLYLARLLTAISATALATVALAVCAKGRTVLFVILCLPMVLSLFASTSQDGLALGAGALVVALFSRYFARNQDMPLWLRAGAALLLGCIVAARIPLIALYALMLIPTSANRRIFSRTWLGRNDVVSIAIGLLPIGFGVFGAHAAKVAFKVREGVSPGEQARWMLANPFEAGQVAVSTLYHYGTGYLREMVGVLGWLDTYLPEAYYAWIAFCLLLALLVDALSPERSLRGALLGLHGFIVVGAVAGVFGGLYLAWTPVGAELVDGVQGRYLLVPVMLAVLAIPTVRGGSRSGNSQKWLSIEGARLTVCSTVAAVNLWVVPKTILHRFYG